MFRSMQFLMALIMSGFMVIVTTDISINLIETSHAQALSSSLQFKVKKIATDIASSRSNLATHASEVAADAFKARQFKQRVDSYATVLGKMPSVDDPVLISAKQDLAELQKEFEVVMAGGGASSPSDSAPASQSAIPSQASSTVQSTSQSAQPSSGPQLVSGQRVQIRKLATNIANVMGDIIVTGPSPMQSSEVVGKYNKNMQQFADALGRYVPYKDDPDVRTAAANYQALVNAITTEHQRAQS